MSRGVIYISCGPDSVASAKLSMASLWSMAPAMPVLIVGDREATAYFCHDARVTCHEVQTDQARGAEFLAGYVKPLLAALSPFDESLYVDTDTRFQNAPAFGFGMLARWDVILAEMQAVSVLDSVGGRAETEWTAEWMGTPDAVYHHSGMLFWRRAPVVRAFFNLWAEEWKRFQDSDGQLALLRALLRSEAVYHTVPHTWNFRSTIDSTFRSLRFGLTVASAGDTGKTSGG